MRHGFTATVILLVSWASVPAAEAQHPVTPGQAESAKPLDSEEVARVRAKVLPKEGFTLPIKWGDLGSTLVRLGVLDLPKLKQLHADTKGRPLPDLRHLEERSEAFITITTENARFLANVFWGLGLANKNPVLDTLVLVRPQSELMRLASTGGWTLGAKPAEDVYSYLDIVALQPEQQELVSDLARTIYRPCCDNPTAFPDCNHGMAMLGLLELMAANGFSREEILRAALRFNAFWFPQQYVRTALVLQLRGIDWDTVDPQEILGPRYSSLRGWIQNVDGELKKRSHLLPPQPEGASCGISR
ncbi:MAG: hypothetical protein HY726_07380 [Candidatus Rokubacteria bacterium]|nr:hypothetical protein [Candidatus Rokubacteria bacterium]